MPPERTSRGQVAKVHHVSGYRGCGLGVAVVVAAPCPCPPGYHQSPGSERKRAAVSQFHVSVCLTPTAPGPVRAALTAALAPFDMNRPKEGNPDGQWDRWYIDGGENRFAVNHNTTAIPASSTSRPGPVARPANGCRCDATAGRERWRI